MDKRTLKGWLNKENLTPAEKKSLIKLWDTAFMWGGYEGYFTIKEMAFIMELTQDGVRYRLKKFKEDFPEAFERINAHRKCVKSTTTRLNKSLRSPLSYEELKEQYNNSDDMVDSWIKEKF